MKFFEEKSLGISSDLEGLSLKMISEHYRLYQGYVKKSNEIRTKISEADKGEANGTFSIIGELKRQEGFAINGMRLHEIYFDLLGGNGIPKGELKERIEKSYGSIDVWREDLIASGLSARGWVLVCIDRDAEEVKNYSLDAHNVGTIVNTTPVIALDVYEHAYFIDYGTDRRSYIESYLNNLNWGKAVLK